MDGKLKALKVVELKEILTKASIPVPAKANKQDLIAKILSNPNAVHVYNLLYAAKPAVNESKDDLVRFFF
jgi:SAP domain-containing ribonucleoprotein